MPHSLKLIIKCRLSDKKWLLILIKQMELSEFPTDAISAFPLVLTPKSANRVQACCRRLHGQAVERSALGVTFR